MIRYTILKPDGTHWESDVISVEEMQGCVATMMQYMPGYQIIMQAADGGTQR